MDEKFTSENIGDNDFNLNSQESDYHHLITTLKEISSKISLLEKQYLDKL